MKIGVNRMGGNLTAGDEETYTADSTGTVTVEFKRDSLPGDQREKLFLVAKVEDNDQYGNLSVEKTVPWGAFTAWRKLSKNAHCLLPDINPHLVNINGIFYNGRYGELLFIWLRKFKNKKMGKQAYSFFNHPAINSSGTRSVI